MTSRTERFQRKPKDTEDTPADDHVEVEEIVRFSPEEESALLNESNAQKAEANKLFSAASYTDAIATYDKALSTCPNYLNYEIAVLKSNIAACYLKLEDWKEAVKAASAAIDGLDKLEGKGTDKRKKAEGSENVEKKVEEEEADEEILSAGAEKAEDTSAAKKKQDDIERIRSKALMRRAKARTELGGWATLQTAEEDYKELSKMENLPAADKRLVQQQLIYLPPKVKAAQESEVAEMMGKLKTFGNGILGKFGLSTDNFQMVKDEKTGGYSMNLNQGGS